MLCVYTYIGLIVRSQRSSSSHNQPANFVQPICTVYALMQVSVSNKNKQKIDQSKGSEL